MFTKLTIFLGALACGLASTTLGCKSDTEVVRSAPSASGPLHVALRSVRVTPSGEQTFAIKSEAKTGERLAFYVKPNSDAYVYVVQFDATRTPTVIFPAQGDGKVAANQVSRIPPAGDFELDDKVGTENVYVLATRQPLDAQDPELGTLVRDARTSPSSVQQEAVQVELPPPSQPPAKPTLTPSGTKTEGSGEGTVLVEKTDDAPTTKIGILPATAPAAVASAPPGKVGAPVKVAFSRPPTANRVASLKTRSLTLLESPCPPGVTCRGLKLVGDDWYDADEDEKGVSIILFAFEHVK